MSKYKFEISVNGFPLKTHMTITEKAGHEWCLRYMSRFQREVANLQMKVVISKRDGDKYGGGSFVKQKVMYKKPLRKKEE